MDAGSFVVLLNGTNHYKTLTEKERHIMNAPKQNEYLLLFRGNEWWNHLSAEELQQAMNRFRTWFDGLSVSKRALLPATAPPRTTRARTGSKF
ncbi:hypothetical protein SBV1_310019 [Verrucomicrobia bacterium]|nr:hypothetical protein SBV1_310019 [Verrucomicrobiota bacterium]